MKRLTIGFLYSGKSLGKEEKMFLDVAERYNIQLVPINILQDITPKRLEERLRYCKIVYNGSGDDFAIEYVRTLEEMGKIVVDSSDAHQIQDKWIFYLRCKKNNIPTPKTFLIPKNMNIAKKILRNFGKWPIILKGVTGTMGEQVKKADNLEQAKEIIGKFLKKDYRKLPMIAQEFIPSPSYRVTVINGNIVQTALKENKSGWKATGVYAKTFKKFQVDKTMKKIVDKVMRIVKIDICGIDFLRKGKHWYVLEVNSEPSLDFFPEEHEAMIEEVVSLLKNRMYEISEASKYI